MPAHRNNEAQMARVHEVVAATLGIARDRVQDGARFVEDLGASSLDLVELIMAIEEAFAIEISDSAAEKIHTVGELVAFVQLHHVAAARAAAGD